MLLGKIVVCYCVINITPNWQLPLLAQNGQLPRSDLVRRRIVCFTQGRKLILQLYTQSF